MRDANGLQYHRARYMNPALGVFTALDPFEGMMDRPMSLNGYTWVSGNPINNVDPSGMQDDDDTAVLPPPTVVTARGPAVIACPGCANQYQIYNGINVYRGVNGRTARAALAPGAGAGFDFLGAIQHGATLAGRMPFADYVYVRAQLPPGAPSYIYELYDFPIPVWAETVEDLQFFRDLLQGNIPDGAMYPEMTLEEWVEAETMPEPLSQIDPLPDPGDAQIDPNPNDKCDDKPKPCDPQKVIQWMNSESVTRVPVTQTTNAYNYQRTHCGATEYSMHLALIGGGNRRVVPDNVEINTCRIVDCKYVDPNSKSSPYVPGSVTDRDVEKMMHGRTREQFKKYRHLIKRSDYTGLTNILVITNNKAAEDYFGSVLSSLAIPGQVDRR